MTHFISINSMFNRIQTFLVGIIALSFIIYAGCGGSGTDRSLKESRIVFLSNREAPERQFDIFVINPDGTSLMNLTRDQNGITSVSHPVSSPDGKKIVYLAFRQHKKFLMSMNVDGADPEVLIEVNIDSPDPIFSADGKKLIYINKVKDLRQIHIYDFELRSSTNISDNDADEFEAVFSPDGDKIALVSDMDTNNKCIWLMNDDGSERIMLTDQAGESRYPDFAPDGEHIAFCSSSDGDFEIYLMDAEDGTDLIKLTNNDVPDLEPRFSPDGSSILFSSNLKGIRSKHLILLNRKTRNTINITEDSGSINQHARFSPDGKQVVFESIDGEIYLIDVADLNLRNLTNDPHWDCAPEF